MANVKITDLAALTNPASTDVLPIVDVGADVTKKISIADLLENAGSGTESAPGIAFDGDSNTGIYHPGPDQLAISTNGTGRLFIDNVGRVGLGNASSPVDDLHILSVNPAIVLEESDAGTDEKYWRTRVDNSAYIFEGLTDAFGSPSFWLRVFRATNSEQIDNIQFATSGNERLRIASDGKLGLGTSSPVSSLHIADSNPQVRVQDTDGTNQTGIFYKNGAATTFYSQDGTSNGSFLWVQNNGTTSTTSMVLSSSGNLGIGTTSPSQLLEINGGNVLVESSAGNNITLSTLVGNGNDSTLVFKKARGGASPAQIVASDDLGAIQWQGYDGSSYNEAAKITCKSSTNTGDFDAALIYEANEQVFRVPGSETARIDSSGRLLAGTSSAFTGFNGGLIAPFVQIAGDSNNTSFVGFIRTDNSAAGSAINFAKSRSTSYAIVQEDDELGRLDFQGADGTNLTVGARIAAFVDGTPGADDMPGRLVFSVTADGASSPTEAMRIKNTRVINFSNAPVYADNAAAKTGGLVDGDVYRTSTGDLKIVYT